MLFLSFLISLNYLYMKKLNIAFFASHGGSNFQSIVENIQSGEIKANASLLITNNSDCFAIQRAINLNIPYVHISSLLFDTAEKFQSQLLAILKEYKIDLIVLAGYMRKIPLSIIKQYPNRILNIHPALLPKFGGQGMYGMNVHNAVFDAKEKETGATVHLVNEEYDQGKILKQQKILIDKDDTPETIAEKVLQIEHKLYSQTIKEIANNMIKLD